MTLKRKLSLAAVLAVVLPAVVLVLLREPEEPEVDPLFSMSFIRPAGANATVIQITNKSHYELRCVGDGGSFLLRQHRSQEVTLPVGLTAMLNGQLLRQLVMAPVWREPTRLDYLRCSLLRMIGIPADLEHWDATLPLPNSR